MAPCSLLRCEGEGGLRPLVDCGHLAAEQMESTGVYEGRIRVVGIRPLLHHDEGLMIPLKGLVRIAQQPQEARHTAEG